MEGVCGVGGTRGGERREDVMDLSIFKLGWKEEELEEVEEGEEEQGGC